MALPALLFAVAFVLLLAGAAVQDIRSRTISNGWPAALLLLFGFAWWSGVIAGPLGSHLLHFAIALIVGILLFAVHWVGGGDAKLYAAAALWFTLGDAIYLFLCVALFGAILALVHLVIAMIGNSRAEKTRSLREKKLAYGIAIAVGAVIALPHALS